MNIKKAEDIGEGTPKSKPIIDLSKKPKKRSTFRSGLLDESILELIRHTTPETLERDKKKVLERAKNSKNFSEEAYKKLEHAINSKNNVFGFLQLVTNYVLFAEGHGVKNSLIQELVKLANELDSKGLTKEADKIDILIKKASDDQLLLCLQQIYLTPMVQMQGHKVIIGPCRETQQKELILTKSEAEEICETAFRKPLDLQGEF